MANRVIRKDNKGAQKADRVAREAIVRVQEPSPIYSKQVVKKTNSKKARAAREQEVATKASGRAANNDFSILYTTCARKVEHRFSLFE